MRPRVIWVVLALSAAGHGCAHTPPVPNTPTFILLDPTDPACREERLSPEDREAPFLLMGRVYSNVPIRAFALHGGFDQAHGTYGGSDTGFLITPGPDGLFAQTFHNPYLVALQQGGAWVNLLSTAPRTCIGIGVAWNGSR